MGDKLLRMAGVQEMVGLSRTTIYEMVKKGSFPRPVRISERNVAWRESALLEWLESRKQA